MSRYGYIINGYSSDVGDAMASPASSYFPFLTETPTPGLSIPRYSPGSYLELIARVKTVRIWGWAKNTVGEFSFDFLARTFPIAVVDAVTAENRPPKTENELLTVIRNMTGSTYIIDASKDYSTSGAVVKSVAVTIRGIFFDEESNSFALDAGGTVDLYDVDDPVDRVEFGGDVTAGNSSFRASIFSRAVLTSDDNPSNPVDGSLFVEFENYWGYRDAAGDNPIWDESTGALLIDPIPITDD